MNRLRTIKDAAAFFKSVDPQTGLTEYAIRTLLRTGKVPCIRVGTKYLVAIEALEAYLSPEQPAERNGSAGSARKEWRIK